MAVDRKGESTSGSKENVGVEIKRRQKWDEKYTQEVEKKQGCFRSEKKARINI